MSFDNLAIPEVNTKSHDDNEDNVGEDDSSVTYDTVAIPEIHIRKKKDKSYLRLPGCVRIQSGDFVLRLFYY